MFSLFKCLFGTSKKETKRLVKFLDEHGSLRVEHTPNGRYQGEFTAYKSRKEYWSYENHNASAAVYSLYIDYKHDLKKRNSALKEYRH